MEYLSAHMTCFYQIKNGSRADMLVHGPGNKVPGPFYFLQFGSDTGGADEDGRNLPQSVVISMEADRLNCPARKRFSPEVSFALNERAMRRGRFPCS